MDFDLDDEPAKKPDPESELVPMPSLSAIAADAHAATIAKADRGLKGIEDRMFEQSAGIVEDMLSFRDIDPGAEEPPESWVRALGSEEAWRRLRVAKASWLSAAKAPVALSLATKTAAAIMKARATLGQGPRELNLQVQFIHAPMADYPTKKVGGDR